MSQQREPTADARQRLRAQGCLSDDDDISLRVAKSVGTIEDVLLKGHCTRCAK